jgi:glycogen operon protein
MERVGEVWFATFPQAADGLGYHVEVDGVGPLLDPWCHAVRREPDGTFRSELRLRPWPRGRRLDARPLGTGDAPVVYEIHVRGFGRTFAGMIDHLDHVARLGVDVVELMPVHPFDTSDNYWGYMPLVWGAVHSPYSSDDDAAAELAALVAACHERGLAVWLDVVYNHTAEMDREHGITTSWRGLAEHRAYVFHDGVRANDSGCGNDTNVSEPEMQAVILESLQRLADLGIDGFRFDLASLLTRDGGGLARRIGDWAEREGVALIAEPWDLGAYQVGDAFPDPRWAQWNDRFREDVRGFLRAEPNLVPSLVQRVQGSPDLFHGQPWRTLNFITAHDGLTLHDLTIRTDDHHRSWDCGPDLRLQQLKNAFCYLLLSEGPAMFVMGDEFGRTQGGDPNPYNVDSPVTWVDWSQVPQWQELVDFVRELLTLRRRTPVVAPTFHGVEGEPDLAWHSRSLAWSTDDLVVLANTWWEPLTFRVPREGNWQLGPVTAPLVEPLVEDVVVGGATVTLAPRSVAVLTR